MLVSTSLTAVSVTDEGSFGASVYAAPASLYVSPSSILTVLAPINDKTGAVVSTTFTVLVAVPVLPEASVAEYVMV